MSQLMGVLTSLLPEEAAALIGALGGAVHAPVHLLVGDLGVEEALAFASYLTWVGQEAAADEILTEVLAAAFG